METKLRDELIQFGLFFIACLFIFKIVFFKEDLQVVIMAVGGFFYTFIIPGYALMYYFNDTLDFIERLVIGTVLGLALFGIISYYTGLLGLSIRYQSLLLPGLFIIVGSFLYRFREKEK